MYTIEYNYINIHIIKTHPEQSRVGLLITSYTKLQIHVETLYPLDPLTGSSLLGIPILHCLYTYYYIYEQTDEQSLNCFTYLESALYNIDQNVQHML